jgi:hypothetical protein
MRPGNVLIVGVVVTAAACSSSSGNSPPEPRPSVRSAPVSSGTVRTSTSTAATLGIPPGHLPPPGECRIWVPGTPPGHQRDAGNCSTLERQVPQGAWLIHRPSKDKKVVNVWVYDSAASLPTVLRVFDAVTGVLIGEELL